MRLLIPSLFAFLACPALADEVEAHRFEKTSGYQPAGWPDLPPKLNVLAEKPLRLDFPGLPADWKPAVQAHRITSARKVSIETPEAEATADGWQWTWTPPKTQGPAHYEILFDGEPKRIVRIETRDPAWLKATLEMLSNQAEWDALGLTPEERAALTEHGLKLSRSSASAKTTTASLEMRPRQGDAARRRIVWDEENPSLLVWRPGPATGDLEARAPRWWISPAALATDQGLIRFLDLFSEPPLNP
jgi:hypothetical protein